jgi:hypothetical protein
MMTFWTWIEQFQVEASRSGRDMGVGNANNLDSAERGVIDPSEDIEMDAQGMRNRTSGRGEEIQGEVVADGSTTTSSSGTLTPASEEDEQAQCKCLPLGNRALNTAEVG